MRLIPRRLAPRLVLIVTLLVALGCSLSAWLDVRTLEQQLMKEKTQAADQLSRSITSATWHAMRAGRQEDAYDVMATMAEQQGVDYVRIFAKMGRVAFSTVPDGRRRVEIDAHECQACHLAEPPLIRLDTAQRLRFLDEPGEERRLAILTPLYNEPACSTAACHVHPERTRVLGILDLAVGLESMDSEIRRMQWSSMLIAFMQIGLLGGILALFVNRFLGRPIRALTVSTERVANMDLDTPVAVPSDSELGDLGRAFDVMRTRLREARAQNVRFTAGLEEQVEERGRELATTQRQLIEADRLASLGQLAASVAHEVNNPISAVHNLAIFLQRILAKDGISTERLPAFERHLGQIASESARAGHIVQDLLSFARHSKVQRTEVDLNQALRDTLEIVGHRVELARVDLILELSPTLPRVSCDPSQFEQVVMNLALNAVEAMPDGGRLVVRTGLETATDMVVIQLEDSGQGIRPDILRHVFDPFFSTKTGEKGVGLGLAVAYGIVDAHGGRLNVQSTAGQGTVFTIRLPLHPAAPPPPENETEEKR